jgi:hypothetical protein
MSAATCSGPDRFLRQLDGREHRALRTADAKTRRAGGQRRGQAFRHLGAACAVAVQPGLHRCGVELRQHLVQPGGQARGDHFHGVLAAHGQQVLAVQGRLDVAPAQQGGDFLLDVLGLPFFQHQHGALADAEVRDLVGHQRAGHVEHQRRDVEFAKRIGQAELLQRAHQRVREAPLHDQAQVVVLPRQQFVEAVLDDVAARSGDAVLVLQLLVPEGDGRVRQARIVKGGRLHHQRARGDGGRAVVARREAAAHMAGADAQLHQRGHVAGFAEAKPCSTRSTMRPRSGRGSSKIMPDLSA